MLPYLQVIIAGLIWGSSGIFIRKIGLPSTTLSFFRAAVPTLAVLAYFLYRRSSPLHAGTRFLILASVLNAVRMPLYFLGFQYTSIGNAVVTLYTWPIFVMLISSLLLKEKMTPDKRLCLILAFCGVGIVASAKGISTGSRDLIGMLFMLTQSAVYAISLILLKKFSTAFSRLEMIFCQNIAAVLLFAPFLLINRPLPTYSQAGLSSTYALLIGLVAFIFFYSALKKFPAGQASLLAYIEVPAAIVYGSIFFGEPLTPQLCIGGSLIIGSALWLTLRRDKEKVANTQEEILGSD